MATSGSDETELDSESVIDPVSLRHCSDIIICPHLRRSGERPFQRKFLSASAVGRCLNTSRSVRRETTSPTAAFVQATFLFRMVGLTTSNGMYQDPFTSKDRRTRVVYFRHCNVLPEAKTCTRERNLIYNK